MAPSRTARTCSKIEACKLRRTSEIYVALRKYVCDDLLRASRQVCSVISAFLRQLNQHGLDLRRAGERSSDMSTRYDDRDYDRDSQSYGRRSESDSGRSWGGRAQGGYRSSNRERDTERYGREGGYGGDYSSRNSEYGGGRGEHSGGRGDYGSSRSSNYGSRSSEYGSRGGSDYGRASEYERDRSQSRPRGYQGGYDTSRRGYGSYGRGGWESERDDIEDRDERYGGHRGGYGEGGYNQQSRYGRSSGSYGESDYGQRSYGRSSGSGRGGSYGRSEGYGGRSGQSSSYGEGYSQQSGRSDRYNYPTGFRSGRSYEDRGGGYDYSRGDYDRSGYGRGEERGSRGEEDRYGRGEERGWWDRASDTIASWFGDEDAERRRRMDQRRGRGPKNYRRSDERIREDINDRLGQDYYLDAFEVVVAVENGEVTLTGNVNSRDDKRRAEEIAESVSGVNNVENRLRVQRDMGTYGTTYGAQGSNAYNAGTGLSTVGSSGTEASGTKASGTGGYGTSSTGTSGSSSMGTSGAGTTGSTGGTGTQATPGQSSTTGPTSTSAAAGAGSSTGTSGRGSRSSGSGTSGTGTSGSSGSGGSSGS